MRCRDCWTAQRPTNGQLLCKDSAGTDGGDIEPKTTYLRARYRGCRTAWSEAPNPPPHVPHAPRPRTVLPGCLRGRQVAFQLSYSCSPRGGPSCNEISLQKLRGCSTSHFPSTRSMHATTPKKRIYLNFFEHGCVGSHMSPGQWR